MRAAIYTRVSSDDQVENFSLDAQLRACRDYARQQGWTVVHEFVEEGRSARTDMLSKRPQLMQMMDDVERHRFDVIVVHKLDRFSRNVRVTQEQFDRLMKANVDFVSITENMNFGAAWGQLGLNIFSSFAQYYSDNLAQEVKKGKAERKAQGFYNGLLPFGCIKGEDRIPVPNPETFPGLKMAFDLAGQGRSDREVARALNAAGYRTAGNRGSRPFTKDIARGVLMNRFYLGYLPDGDGDWVDARHEAFIDPELFEQAQDMRARNRKVPKTIARGAHTYSLSSVLRCVECDSPMWIHSNSRGRARIYCRQRAKGSGCVNRGTFMDVYEAQIVEYLRRFVLPEDYRAQILGMYHHLQQAEGDSEGRRRELEGRLERIKYLYEWGDKTKEDYLSESREIKEELTDLTPPEQRTDVLGVFRVFLEDVAAAWEKGTDEQKNRLARQMFDIIWTKDEKVVAVRPRAELRPFFQVSERCQEKSLSGDPDRIRGHMCNTSIYSMHFAQQCLRHRPTKLRFQPMIYQSCWASEKPTVFASWPVNTVSPMRLYARPSLSADPVTEKISNWILSS